MYRELVQKIAALRDVPQGQRDCVSNRMLSEPTPPGIRNDLRGLANG